MAGEFTCVWLSLVFIALELLWNHFGETNFCDLELDWGNSLSCWDFLLEPSSCLDVKSILAAPSSGVNVEGCFPAPSR